jgi:hypothetical protein
MGGGIPAGMLQHIAKDIFGDSSSSRDKEQTNVMVQAVSDITFNILALFVILSITKSVGMSNGSE